MSSDENEYFKQQDMDKIAEARRAAQLAAIRQREQAHVQAALNTNEEIAAEALELGFDSDTARVLPLVPLIHMAWIDGSVSNKEHQKVLELAKNFGIERDTPAEEFLELLLTERPSALFFERVQQIVAQMIKEDPEFWKSESILSLATEIAQASGSFFNLTNPINPQERELLKDFAQVFGVEGRATREINAKNSDRDEES